MNKFSLRKNYRSQIKNAISETRKEWGAFYHQYDCSLWENIYTNSNIIITKLFRNSYRKCDDVYPNGLSKKIRNLYNIYHFDALMVNYFYLSRALDAIPIKRKALFTHDAFSMQKNRRSIKQFTILQKRKRKKPFHEQHTYLRCKM